MKKLMTMIAAVATCFGLFAAQDENPIATSFEANDAGVSAGAFTPGDGWTWDGEPLPLGAYDGDAYAYDEEGPKARRSSAFVDAGDQASYLPLKTEGKELTRAVGDVFLDQLVKFTGFEEDPVIGESDGVKIAIWLKATESEGDVVGETNLYVTAAKVVGEDQIVATNFLVAGDWAVDKWYRLTVKNIGSIYEENPTDDSRAGFIVYVDGVQVASEDAKGIVYFDSEMTKDAKKYMAQGQLFPAIDTTDVAFNSVGYKGIGAIDDIIVDTQGPEFAQTIECTFTINTTGVDGIEIDMVKDEDGEDIEEVAGVYTVPQGTTVTVTYKPADGYKQMGNLEQTQPINADKTVIAADESIKVAQIIATVQNGLVSPVPYAETELLDMIENLKNGDFVLFKEGGVITGDEEAALYEFAADTTIGVTIENGTTTWEIHVVGESAFTDNVGVPANFVKIATLDPEYPEGCAYALGDVEIAGTLKVDGTNLSDNMDTVTLVGEGKLITKTEGLEDQLLPEGEIAVAADTPEVGWYTYTIQSAVLPTLTYTDSPSENYVKWLEFTFPADGKGVGYDDWKAMFKVVSSVDINEGEITFNSTFGSSGTNKLDFKGCKANEEFEVMLADVKDITVDYMYTTIQTLYWGIRNIALSKQATFNIELVITDGATTQTLCTIPEFTLAKKEYDVYFMKEGGEQYDHKKVVINEYVTDVPNIPAKEGYDGAWNPDPQTTLIVSDTVFRVAYTIKTYDVTFSTNSIPVVEKTVTGVEHGSTLQAGQIPTDFGTGSWEVDPATAVITCDTNFNFKVVETPVIPIPVKPDADLTEKGKAAQEAIMKEFVTPAAIKTWAGAVYADGEIPASKLNGTTPELIAIAKAYNIPVLTEDATVTTAQAADGAFTFKIVDGGDVYLFAAKVENMIKYSDDLGTFGVNTDKVGAEVQDDKVTIKAVFSKPNNEAKGFMKLELTAPDMTE